MPIYEYACSACGQAFEHLARTLSDKPSKCPSCGAKKLSIRTRNPQTRPKDARLVPAARMMRIKAVVAKLSDFYNRSTAARELHS